MKKRLVGLAVGLAALSMSMMAPAQAGSSTKGYVGGGAAGLGLVSGQEVDGKRVGGVRFDGVSGTKITIEVADASGLGVTANVSFRKPADPNNPTGAFDEIDSRYLCGTKLSNATIPSGTTFVVVFMQVADPELPVFPGFGCPAGKGGLATTGTVKATWS
jgi:opacity protein-like surface antigen